jgi:hypothetical protein
MEGCVTRPSTASNGRKPSCVKQTIDPLPLRSKSPLPHQKTAQLPQKVLWMEKRRIKQKVKQVPNDEKAKDQAYDGFAF